MGEHFGTDWESIARYRAHPADDTEIAAPRGTIWRSAEQDKLADTGRGGFLAGTLEADPIGTNVDQPPFTVVFAGQT